MNPTALDALVQRWSKVRWFWWAGSGCVVIGGLVAAVTGPLELGDGSWLAAFLVLVGGVVPIALGAGQAWLSPQEPSSTIVRTQLIAWYIGVVATVVGTLIASPVLTSAGAVAVAVALGAFLVGVRRPSAADRRLIGACYRTVAGLVLVSLPVGVFLSWSRHG